MKSLIGFIMFLIFIAIVILFIIFTIFGIKIENLFNFFERKTIENKNETFKIGIKTNETYENQTFIEEKQKGVLSSSIQNESSKKERIIHIEIKGICFPRAEEETRIIEGSGMDCLNEPQPYYLDLYQINETSYFVNFTNYDFYAFSTGNPLFIVYIRGINLVAEEVDNIYFNNTINLYSTNYTVYTIWINNEIFEISASIPAFIKQDYLKNSIEEVKFYVDTLNKTYYAGSVFINYK